MTDAPAAPRLLIAEDEPLLAAQLAHELALAWPEARVVETVGDGLSAVDAALRHRPDVCFLDIRMPGQTGLEAAQALAEDWPDDTPLPLLVFVTAYDQYAVDAFERAAADYVLKPVQPARLARTVATLRERLAGRTRPLAAPLPADLGDLGRLLSTLGARLGGATAGAGLQAPPAARLRVIQAGTGTTITMVPVDDVLVFEAADKYVRVVTATREHLIRVSLRELLPQLDDSVFWQVHRGTVVRIDAVERAVRDESGRVTLHLRGSAEKPVVSRLYAHRFKPM